MQSCLLSLKRNNLEQIWQGTNVNQVNFYINYFKVQKWETLIKHINKRTQINNGLMTQVQTNAAVLKVLTGANLYHNLKQQSNIKA